MFPGFLCNVQISFAGSALFCSSWRKHQNRNYNMVIIPFIYIYVCVYIYTHLPMVGLTFIGTGKPNINVSKTLCFKPPMTGNGKHTTYFFCDDWGMVRLWHCFTCIISLAYLRFARSLVLELARSLEQISGFIVRFNMVG